MWSRTSSAKDDLSGRPTTPPERVSLSRAQDTLTTGHTCSSAARSHVRVIMFTFVRVCSPWVFWFVVTGLREVHAVDILLDVPSVDYNSGLFMFVSGKMYRPVLIFLKKKKKYLLT